MLQSMIDAFRTPAVRARILFVLGCLIVFRFMAHIPVPGVDRTALDVLFQSNQLVAFFDLFSGGGLRNLSIVALGVYPYITSSIVMQILTPIIPSLSALSKEGEAGRQRINQITHWITVPIAIMSGYGQLLLFSRAGVITHPITLVGDGSLETLTIVVSFVGGTMFLIWLGELMTERGIGNGLSIIIFAGIVAGFPTLVGQGFLARDNAAGLLILAAVGLLLVFFIVIFNEAQRRVPVQYGRSVFRGGRVYRQSGATHLPLRVNSAGMIPLIFAFSIMILPGTIAGFFYNPSGAGIVNSFWSFIYTAFSPTSFVYWLLVFFLVVIFTFFYTMVIFQQQQLAENLQKNGGFIPGIRPGAPTQQYLNRVMLRITWGGALFLGLVAVLPFIFTEITGVQALQLSSTSLLIVVSVALETMRQLEAQLLMRNYEGFLR
ncbi:MAG: preprotein translocase subunit SecY [SAR202 cluster bacterium]|nr:preprotein translocase subunit SecY [SAR202 cluster bacterium]